MWLSRTNVNTIHACTLAGTVLQRSSVRVSQFHPSPRFSRLALPPEGQERTSCYAPNRGTRSVVYVHNALYAVVARAFGALRVAATSIVTQESVSSSSYKFPCLPLLLCVPPRPLLITPSPSPEVPKPLSSNSLNLNVVCYSAYKKDRL